MTWTSKSRQTRIDALKKEIRSRKELPKEEVYRFGLRTLRVSFRVIDLYLRELELLDIIKVKPTSTGIVNISWNGGDLTCKAKVGGKPQ